MNELKLHDIKNLLEINENSFFLFLLLIFIGVLLFVFLILFILRFIKNKKQNDKKIYFNKLQKLDFSKSKQCAYTITKYGRLLVNNEREKKILEELIEELNEYKYKKEVKTIDEQLKAKISNFLDILDVK